MKRFLIILFLVTTFAIFVQAEPNMFDNQAQYGIKGSCTGGACLMQDVQSNTMFENKNIFSPQTAPLSEKIAPPVTTDGLANPPAPYNVNCEFGNCDNAVNRQ